MSVNNSYFDAIADLSVEDVLSSSELILAASKELLAGTQAYDLLFNPVKVNALTVAYNEDVAPGLDQEVRKVPEFGEIPVGDPRRGKKKYADIEKYAIGIRVSYEQEHFTSGADVQRELVARMAEVRRANSLAALEALAEADIEEFPVATKWSEADATPVDDLYATDDLISGARDDLGNPFNYSAGYVWANRRTLNALKRAKQTKDLYTGDMAHANPLFADISRQPLIAEQFRLVPDQTLADGVAYVFADEEYGKIGSRFQLGEPKTSDWYSEGGDSTLGGSTMSKRTDWVHWRGLAVRAPKAIVKVTGAL